MAALAEVTRVNPAGDTEQEQWSCFMRGLEQLKDIRCEADAISLPSYCQAWISPGDVTRLAHSLALCSKVFFIPAGYQIIEKALVENSIAYRVCSGALDYRSIHDLKVAKHFFPRKLGLNGLVSGVRSRSPAKESQAARNAEVCRGYEQVPRRVGLG